MEHRYAVIMAGGGGTRLWPISRKERPKQLLPLIGTETLFQSTVQRLENLFAPAHIHVVTVSGQAREMQRQTPTIPAENYIVEPEPRGTACVVGLAAALLQRRDPAASMAVLPSDHFIRNRALFHDLMRAAFEVAEDGYLVTLGISPSFPSTAYGYIEQGQALPGSYGHAAYAVKSFKEKPDQQTAGQFHKSNAHSWNSGIFVWKAQAILAEIRLQLPALAAALDEIALAWGTGSQEQVLKRTWQGLEVTTVDFGIMEKAKRVAVLPAGDLGWSDVGSWQSLFEVLASDDQGNIAANNAQHLGLETRNTLVYSEDSRRLIVTIGLEDMVIVEAGDVLLVCRADQSQKVREVVAQLRQQHQERFL
jgi:mannose-1-phosphate guanylyltransferase